MEETPDDKIKGLRLFDDIQRTQDGIRGPRQSHFCFLNRSAWDRSDKARKLCEKWFDRYKQDASQGEINDLQKKFRSKPSIGHYSAWFELLVHQILVRLGASSIDIHPELSGTSNHPDFMVNMDDSRMIVEATVVAPDDERSVKFQRDAINQLYRLQSEVFWVRIREIKGTLKRSVPERNLLKRVQAFLDENDPNQAPRMIAGLGNQAVLQKTFKFDDWQITIALRPMKPNDRGPKGNIVSGPGGPIEYGKHVPHVRKKIKDKAKKYGQVQDPLIIALNSYSRDASFDLGIDAKNVLFGDDGVWGTSENPRYKQLTGVLVIKDTNSHNISSTQARLYINPFASPDIISRIPKSLYRFPHVTDGDNLIQGESVPSLLGLP